MVLKRLQNRSS